jgi:hypothetical protein
MTTQRLPFLDLARYEAYERRNPTQSISAVSQQEFGKVPSIPEDAYAPSRACLDTQKNNSKDNIMMKNMSFRDMIFPEFSGGSYSPSGGGGLGEPGYQGRTADESTPPGWTPNPLAWDPFLSERDPYSNKKKYPGGDPFYSALNTAARQTQEPWTIERKISVSQDLLAFGIDAAKIEPTDFTSSPTTSSPTILAGQTRIDQVQANDGCLYNHYRVPIDGVTYDVYVKAGVIEPDRVILERAPESARAGDPAGSKTAQPASAADAPVQILQETVITGSDPVALKAAEGRGWIELGDWKALAKGGVNGLVNLVGDNWAGPLVPKLKLPNFDIDPNYGGAGIFGDHLATNLALEGLSAAPALESALRKALASKGLATAVRAPVFWAMGVGGVGGGIPPSTPSIVVTGPSFADTSTQLGLEIPGTITYRSAAGAALGARAGGLEAATDAAFQTHATAPIIRQVFNILGSSWQSAHIVPQAVYRALRAAGLAVSEGRALTILLPSEAHAAFDSGWIAEWNSAVDAGRAIRAGDVYNWVSRAINAVDDSAIGVGVQGAINDRLGAELFGELGLSPDDIIVPARP